MKIFALLAGAFLATACTVTGLPAPDLDVSRPLPLEWSYREGPNGLVLLSGRVNGKSRHDFILDTGAPVTVLIDGPRTAALGFDTSKARPLGDPNVPATPTGIVAFDNTVEFEGVALRRLAAVVIPKRSMPCPERFESIGFDGVVGADLFRSFVVEFDTRARRVRLHEPKAWVAPANAPVLPLVFRAGHPYLQAALRLPGGTIEKADLHFDTGQNRAITLNAGSDAAIAMPVEGARVTICGASGTREARTGPEASLAFGDRMLTDATPTYFAPGARLPDQRHGSIGIGLFQGRRFAVDYPGRRVVLLD